MEVPCAECAENYTEATKGRINFFPESTLGKFIASAHLDCLKSLVKKHGESKEVILMASAAVGDKATDVLQMVISCMDIWEVSDRKMGTKAAQMAARRGNHDILSLLLDLGINPDGITGAGPPGMTATYLAAANGHAPCLKLLLDSGYRGSFLTGFSPLYGAATNGHTDCIRLMIQSGVWGSDQGGQVLRDMVAVGHVIPLQAMVQEFTAIYIQEIDKSPKQRRIDTLQLHMYLQTAAREATQLGDTECLTILLKSSAFDTHSKYAMQNLVTDAAKHGHLDCLRILLQVAYLVSLDEAIISAAEMGHLQCLEMLCETYKLADCTRDQAILHSTINGQKKCLKFLLQSKVLADHPIATPIFEQAVIGASANGNMKSLSVLFQEAMPYSGRNTTVDVIENAIIASITGDHPNCMNFIYIKYHKHILSWMHVKAITTASSLGRTTCLRNLLQMDTFRGVYQRDSESWTDALVQAALNGNEDCVNLLRFKLNLKIYDKPDRYIAPMIDSMMRENIEGLRRLFRLGATPNVTSSKTVDCWDLGQAFLTESDMKDLRVRPEKRIQLIPLFLAVKHEINSAVRLLLECGANPNVINTNGDNPLTIAAAAGNTEAVRLLLRYGADPNVCDAVASAFYNSRLDCLKLLLEHHTQYDASNVLENGWILVWLVPKLGEIIRAAGFFAYPTLTGYREWYHFKESDQFLQYICRSAIRRHLLLQNPRGNLYHLVPKLPLPPSSRKFILYGKR